MERVLGGVDKVIVDKNAGQGVVPYLPLGDNAHHPRPAPHRAGAPQVRTFI